MRRMDPWRQFENRIVKESLLKNIFVSQIPTGCRIVWRNGRKHMQLVKTDFDFASGFKGRAIFFDAKAEGSNTFNFRMHCLSENKLHQFRKLLDAEAMGNAAGYLIWFYHLKKITWVPIGLVNTLQLAGHKSLTPNTPGVRSEDDFIALDIGKLALTL